MTALFARKVRKVRTLADTALTVKGCGQRGIGSRVAGNARPIWPQGQREVRTETPGPERGSGRGSQDLR